MADNITVRTGEGPAPGVGTDGSAKKSKLDQQVEALGEHIKTRTGRAVDEDVLRAMVLRKQARAERAERSAESQHTYLKTTANESLQAQKTEDKGTLIGRPREMNTADGLSSHQRQLVTSDPNAPTILPPATHAPITAEAASNVLEKIFSFLKPGTAEASPLTVEHYSETLVARPPTQPGEAKLRDAGENQPQRPLPEGTESGDVPTDRPTTTQPTAGDRPERPTVNRPTTGQTGGEEHPQRPGETGGRPVTPGEGDPTVPRPQTGNTIHLQKKREPTGGEKTPTHSGATPLGRTVLANARATDGSARTPLGQTTLASATASPAPAPAGPTGPTVPTRPGPPSGPNVPTGPRPGSTGGNVGGPVAGRATRSGQTAGEEHPQRPGEDAGRPVTGEHHEPDVPRPPSNNTVHLHKKREPTGEQPQAPVHSGATPLGQTTLAQTKAQDGSGRTTLGHTTLAATTTTTTGGRPGATGGNVGGPVGGRSPRGATRMPNESSSGGTTLSLRGSRSGGRTTRAVDVTTDPPFVNNGGGFDTTTSWDGMHFNWEAFFVKFMFQFQKDEAEARRLMKELRNAMHKLAQEGIKAKIAIEKMNQAFERAEEAFKLGNAMKGVADAAMQAGQSQGQQEGGQDQRSQGPGGQQPTTGQRTGDVPADQAGAVPSPDSATGDRPGEARQPGQRQPGQTQPGQTQPGRTRAGGPRPASAAADPAADPATATPTSGDAPAGPGGRQRPGQARRGQNQGQGQGEGAKMPGAGLVNNVSEHLRAALEKINADLIGSAQRGASEVDARIRSNYMQAQGLFNQMVQLLAMSRSK